MRVRLAVLALVVLTGCNDATSVSEPRQFTVTPAQQWAGGQITVAGFRGSDDLPVLLAGVDTMVVERLNDSTVRAMLPPAPAGQLRIARARGNSADSIGSVRIFGFLAHDLLNGTDLDGDPLVIQRGGDPWIVGDVFNPSGNSDGIAAVNLATGAHQTISTLTTPAPPYGVGIVWNREDAFILRDTTGALGVWQLWPVPLLLAPVTNTTLRQIVQLSDSVILVTANHSSKVFRSGAEVLGLQLEDPYNVRVDPTGSRTLVATPSVNAFAPVFNNQTGALAYRMSSLKRVAAAAFDATGAHIAAIGGSGFVDSLFTMNSTDGVSTDSAAVAPGGDVLDLLYDPARSRIYVYQECENDPRVTVYNSVTLQVEGRLFGVNRKTSCSVQAYTSSTLAFDAIRQRIYVARAGSPVERFSFDLLP